MVQYMKAIIAFFTSLGTWGYTALAADPNGVESITGAEWFGLCGVVVVTAGVFQASNDDKDPSMSKQAGQTTVQSLLVTAAVAALVTLIVLFGTDVL